MVSLLVYYKRGMGVSSEYVLKLIDKMYLFVCQYEHLNISLEV